MGCNKLSLSDLFLKKKKLDWCDLLSKYQVLSSAGLPIHIKEISKQHRNSVATCKLSDVSQEWQLRVWYHFSFITFYFPVMFCSVLPLALNYVSLPQKSGKNKAAKTRKSGSIKALNLALHIDQPQKVIY